MGKKAQHKINNCPTILKADTSESYSSLGQRAHCVQDDTVSAEGSKGGKKIKKIP